MKKDEILSPKVEALYRAVMELLLEGREVRKMKVSEITERAGIGKGTAYEYFGSREDLLVGALDHFQNAYIESAKEELLRYDSFMGRAGYLFDIVDNVLRKIKKEAMEEICNIFFISPIFRKEKTGCTAQYLYRIVRDGKRGGELREEFPDEYIVLALCGKILDYISYCVREKNGMAGSCTPAEIRDYLLASIRMEFLTQRDLA